MQLVFDQNRGVFAVRINIHAHKDKYTIPSVDLQVRQPRQVCLAVHIRFECRAVGQPYAVHDDGVLVAVIDHHLCGCAALLGEDGVEAYLIA